MELGIAGGLYMVPEIENWASCMQTKQALQPIELSLAHKRELDHFSLGMQQAIEQF